jgi:hydroxyacylglutathione hydrolase
MEVPGHTLDHIAYHNEEWLFCGDTLFSGGCGRMFEGTATQFYHSLQKIASLPASLKVYCTHEYTLANLAFACAVEPNNPSLQAYRQQAEQTRSQQQPTLPTSLERELEINPFLRVDIPEVVERLRTHDSDNLNDSIQRFAALRGWKDQF